MAFAQTPIRILLVEDSPLDCELILHEIKRSGIEVDCLRVETGSQLEDALLEFSPDLILCDYSLPGFSGAEALAITRSKAPDMPFIFVSGTMGEERAVEAIKLGATDYILKDRLKRLVPAVSRALQEARERIQNRMAQAALRETEERFRSFMQHLPGRASVADAEGRYTYVNDRWLSAFGKSEMDVVGRTHSEVWPPERAAALLKAVHREVVETGQPVRRVFTPDQGEHWWLSHHFPIPAEDGKTALVGTIALDVTEQKAQEEKFARLSRIHAVLSGINSAIVRIRDRQRLFEEACRIAVEHGNFGLAWIGRYDSQTLDVTPEAWSGIGTEELLRGKATARLDVPDGQGVLGRALRAARPVFDNDISLQKGVGGRRREEALRLGYRSLIALPLFEQRAVVGCLAMFAKEPDFFTDEEVKLLTDLAGDISFALEYMGKEEKLTYLAYYDPLTGLPNRALFLDRLSQELYIARQQEHKIALVLGDIRRLRFVNESFGRQTGDALLCEIAARWKSVWPDSENVARIAADCLAGVIRDIKEPSDVARLLEGPMHDSLTAAVPVDGKELGASLTLGIALFPTDGGDAETLLRNADAALNKAKKHSEHYAFYQTEMSATVAESLLIENKLRRALENRQFVLHYQPKVNLRTGSVTSMEALIRWHDGETLVPPAQFIPLLEETGMILDVGQWVVRKALADYRQWLDQGLQPPRIAVNVSNVQLKQPNFVQLIQNAIVQAGDGPHGLDLEITESMIMENIKTNIAKLHALRELGIGIAIDDFGTGYSSLSYLAKLPVNALKIDRSFIATMVDSADGMSIVSTIISLAHTLNLEVIAEGVETPEQRRLLMLLKCDELQGYLISRPLPHAEIAALFNKVMSP
ncbi:MAG: EAL domain-containing protein [Betaproteobacteria bacterium]